MDAARAYLAASVRTGMDAHKTLIVGLGNPILGDDGIGWRVAEEVERRLKSTPAGYPQVKVACLALGGLSLMEHLVGYETTIIIDAINLDRGPLGSVYTFPLEALTNQSVGHLSSTHDTTLLTALEVGRSMGAKLPTRIEIVGIESPYTYDFSEELTAPVQAAIPAAVQAVFEILETNGR